MRQELALAAKKGRVVVLNWLLKRGATLGDCRSWDNYPLRSAAKNGHVAVLDWLQVQGITAEDCRAGNNAALRGAAQHNHIVVMDWLIARGLTAEDCRAGNDSVMCGAAAKGNLAVLEWFFAAATRTRDCNGPEEAALCGRALRIAALAGRQEVFDWFLTRFGENKPAVLAVCRSRGNSMLLNAVSFGQAPVLDWLLDRGITLEDCRAQDCIALQLAHQHPFVYEWLFARGFTRAEYELIGRGALWDQLQARKNTGAP